MNSGDIAKGLMWIMSDCRTDDDKVSGYQAAWGNGNIHVQARRTWIGGPP
jgi:hypothetical protein